MIAAGIAVSVAAAGCGGGTSSGPAHVVSLVADPTGALSFTVSHASTTPGKVELTMHNPSTVAHGIAIEGAGVSNIGPVVGRGGVSALTVTLKHGTYTFYCPVPGHRQAGMQGTLTVR